MSGFGLSALMQGLPAGFAFGQQLVGEDADTRNQRMREKLGLAELAQRETQARAQNQYLRDALAQQDAAEKEKLRILEENNLRSYGLDLGRLGVAQQTANQTGAYQTGQLRNQQRQLVLQEQEFNAKAPLWKAQADNAQTQAAMAQAEMARTKEIIRMGRVLQRLAANPFDPDVSDADRALAFGAVQFSLDPQVAAAGREMSTAVRDKGAAALQDPALQRKLLNLPTLRAALNQGLNLQDSQGNTVERIEPEGIEPVEGGARIPITVIKRDASGKRLPPQRSYVTHDRKAMVDGGQPLVFTPQQLSAMFSGLARVGDAPGVYEALPQQLRDAADDYFGASSEADVVNNRLAKAKGRAAAQKEANSELNEAEARRRAIWKDVSFILDRVVDLESLSDKTDPARLRSKRAAIEDYVRGALSGASAEDLRLLTLDQVIQRISPQIADYQRMAEGTAATPPPPGSLRGPVQNSRGAGLSGALPPGRGGRPVDPFLR